MSRAQAELHELEDPKGEYLMSGGGVTLYRRWIETPQGDGSLIGVRATVEADADARRLLSSSPARAHP